MRNLIVFIIQFHDCRVYKRDKGVTEFSEFSLVRLTDGNTSLIICIQTGLSIPVVIHNRQSLSLPIRRSFVTWSNEYEKYSILTLQMPYHRSSCIEMERNSDETVLSEWLFHGDDTNCQMALNTVQTQSGEVGIKKIGGRAPIVFIQSWYCTWRSVKW